jgi:hypothetical protein
MQLNFGPGKWAELHIIQPKKIDAQRGKGAKKKPPLSDYEK